MKQVAVLLMAVLMCASTQADSVNHGGTTINMDFVDIGYAGNSADTTGYGAVGYGYRMGQYEVTLDQFAQARAADSRIGDGDEEHWNTGVRTVGTGGPASFVSTYEAMKFTNWLTSGDAYAGAYQFNGSGVLTGVDRAAAVLGYSTVYVLPTEDEWYKAAYFKPDASGYSDYANGSDDPASVTHGTANGWNYFDTGSGSGYVNGSPNFMWETGFGAGEQNGTYDMMGNVREWSESAWDGNLDNMAEDRALRGGTAYHGASTMRSLTRHIGDPANEYGDIGFRVAAIPEPSVFAFVGIFGGAIIGVRRFFRI